MWNKSTHIKIYLLFLLLVFCKTFKAQPYNNNWINYSQSYYTIKIAENGVYRIDSLTLSNSGVPVASIDPRNFQIIGRGVEIPIHIEGEADGVFNGNDFIEFYAQKNDGWLDSVLYYGADNVPNPYYSLFTDTAVYYLTWNNLTNNNRLTTVLDTNFSSYTPVSYFWYSSILNFNSQYQYGETDYYGGTISKYVPTEGFTDNAFNAGGSKTKNINTSNAAYSITSSELFFTVLGESNDFSLNQDHHLRVTLGSTVFDTIYEGYQKITKKITIPTADLNTNNTSVVIQSINDLGASSDRHAIAYVGIKYPHDLNINNAAFFDNFYVEDHPTETKSLLKFSNINITSFGYLYDLDNNRRLPLTQNGSTYDVLLPNSGQKKNCYLVADNGIKQVTQLSPINGTGNFTDYTAIAPDSAFLIITHPTLMTEANQYAAYRSLTQHNPLVVNVEELYHQFAYGIRKNPLAIRDFCKMAYDTWTIPPKYLFLMGKSIHAPTARNTTYFENNLVPSYGYPPSDNLLTADFYGSINKPLLFTGRLSANNGNEIIWYLDKVNEYENPTIGPNGEAEWMKRVLHFAGGNNSSETNLFLNYLNVFENTIEGPYFGGEVNRFAKNTTVPLQNATTDSILTLIANGVSLMTFFGHASTSGGFDQNIDDPIYWYPQNGKYPFLLGNACLAGDIHTSAANSVSEKYVLIDDKGVIGFLASVSLQTASDLYVYSDEFYRQIGVNNYGKSVGKCIAETIDSIQGNGTNQNINAACLEMTLHGDPAIVINSFDKPDYMVTPSRVYFTPSTVSTALDSFDINIIVTNLGKAINDTIVLELTRKFPNQTYQDSIYYKVFPATKYKDTITFTLPVDNVKGIGLNDFEIFVDALLKVDELYESNNQINVSLNIQNGELIPVYPYNYAIVPNQNVTLKASTANPFEPPKNYIFQIDTTDLYNSPLLQTTNIYQSGGVLTWSPAILQSMPDSMVYFWRVSKDSVDVNGYNWKEHSFQYIPTKRGWEQDHFFQFKNDDYQFIDYNRPARKFDFINAVNEVKAITNGEKTNANLIATKYIINGSTMGSGGWGSTGQLHVAILDSVTLDPWNSNTTQLGQRNQPGMGIRPTFFMYRTNNTSEMNALASALIDSVPNGNYILIYSYSNTAWNTWRTTYPSTLNAFVTLGADSIQTLPDDYPYIFFCKKGDTNSALEAFGDSANHNNVTLTAIVNTNADYGNIYSEILGPALSWDSLFWDMDALEMPTADISVLNVFGVDLNGNETSLISGIPTDSVKMRITSLVNANTYPYLKLSTRIADDSIQTAPQLDRWHVTYEPVPECAMAPNIYFSINKDTLTQGEDLQVAIAIKNISEFDMDSLLVKFTVINKYNQLVNLPSVRYKPLLTDSVIIASVNISTVNYPGLNSLIIEANPNNDQLEQYHFNNYAQINFYAIEDRINPMLDVTFDGIHILDKDIVSPTPEIVIQLTDENQYLLLNDTSDYEVYITNPNGQEKRIYFNSGGIENMQFFPATTSKNKSKIIYNPTFSSDGIYKLRVRATDRSKNQSGAFDYYISFEVINKSTITNILNYPNPFTTSTRFVFTLTGSKIPDVFKIQIMTISGKVVKEISKDELGPIRIGRNITEYAWDGTDEFGDRLANGVYLYRVWTKINNEDIEHRSTEADQYFHRGYGKMYLFR